MIHFFQTLPTNTKDISETVFRQFKQHKCLHQASSLTFTTLLSLVPLSAVALFLLNTFGVVNNEKSPIIATLNNFLPRYRADEIVSGITDFTNRNLAGLGVGGFLFFLLTSIILFMAIEDHFNHIWGSRRLPFVQAIQKYLVFCMLLLIGPLVIWFLFSAGSNSVFVNIFPWISVYCLFVLMYVALPNITVNWKAALIGGLIAGSLFQIARIVFANYFKIVWKNYSEIYGTFAMLIIFAIWIYVSWVVVLLGVEVTNSTQHFIKSKDPLRNTSNETKDIINVPGVITLYLIAAEHFHKGNGACTVSDIASIAKVPESLVQNIFDRFKTANLVYKVEGEINGFLPARSLDTITLDMIIASVDDELTHHFSDASDVSPALVQIFNEIQENQFELLKKTTVRSLLDMNNQ